MRQAPTETLIRPTGPESEPVGPPAPASERWENEGGSYKPAPERTDPAPAGEPFPALEAGKLVLRELELVRLIDERTLGKYTASGKGDSVKVAMSSSSP